MHFDILNLLLVLLAAWLGGLLANRLGYPGVLGELLAGIVAGPPLLGLIDSSTSVDVLAQAGILLMMLYIGMEIDPRELRKASYGGLLAAMGGFITPFVLCYAFMLWLGAPMMAAVFVGVAAGVTALATKSRILYDLKLFDTRVAHVMMAGALVTDTVSLILFAVIVGVAQAGRFDVVELIIVLAKVILFFGASAWLGAKVFPLMGSAISRLKRFGTTAVTMLVLIVALLFAEGAELAGMHGILGTFIAGLVLREHLFGRTLSKSIMEFVRHASIGFLAPVFFVTAGFAVSLDVFRLENLPLLGGIVLLATVGKIAGTALFYLPSGNGWREGLVIGAGKNGRGAVEIIIAQIGLSLGLINQDTFSVLVFMAILTTASVPLFLKWGTDWLRNRGELVRSTEQRNGALIIGGGPTSRAIARILGRSHPVWIVDRNQDLCSIAQAEGLNVICGNAMDEEVLGEAHAAGVRTFIALTPNAEVNALSAQIARTVFMVPEVHVLQVGDAAGHAALLDHLGATTVFGGPVEIADWDYRVDHDEMERQGILLERTFTPDSFYKDLQQTRESLPVAIRREDHYTVYHSGATLQPNDRVIVFQKSDARQEPFDRFDRLAAVCPILDLDRGMDAQAFFEIAAASLAPRLEMDPAELTALLHDRERTSSTVLLPGLAVPHTIIDGNELFEIEIARSREGIVFPDNPERVHAVFILVGSRDERNFHLRALSAVAQIIQQPDFEHAWLTASGAEALRKLVLRAGRRRLPEGPPRPPADRTSSVLL